MKPRFLGAPSQRPTLRMGAWPLPSCPPQCFPASRRGLMHADTGQQRRLRSGGNLIREACAGCCQGHWQGATSGPRQDRMDLPPSQDPGAGIRQLPQLLLQDLGLSWEKPGLGPRTRVTNRLPCLLQAFKTTAVQTQPVTPKPSVGPR